MTTKLNPADGDIIYVMIMPMPQLARNHILLGITHNVSDREKRHNSSNTYPVKCIYARRVEGKPRTAYKIEQALLAILNEYRIPTWRGNLTETLWIEEDEGPTEEDIIEILRLFPGEDVPISETDDETAEHRRQAERIADESAKRAGRKANLNLLSIGLVEGSELNFRYGTGITCKVVDRRTVEYLGENMSLSAATIKALGDVKKNNSMSGVQGSLYWYFDNTMLQTIRDQREDAPDESSDD